MRDFYQENKEVITIVISVIIMVAGAVVMILGHFLVGLIMILGGVLFAGLNFSRIMRSGGYNPEAAFTQGIGGHGRSGNEVGQDKSVAKTSETDGSIWDTMTGK